MTARSLHRSITCLLILLMGIILAPIGMAQEHPDTAKIKGLLSKLNNTAHAHLEAWKNVTTKQQVQAAEHVTTQQLKNIDTLIGQLKRLKKPSNKARQQLTEKMETDLLLLGKHWDSIDARMAKRKTIRMSYLRASAQIEAQLLWHSATLSRWTAATLESAK